MRLTPWKRGLWRADVTELFREGYLLCGTDFEPRLCIRHAGAG